jgi:carboxypeptidase Taq
MEKQLDEQIQSFRNYMKKMKAFEEAAGVLYWDMRTGAPKKGVMARSEVVAMLSAELFRMSISDEMGEYIEFFTQPDVHHQLDEIMRACVRDCAKDYERSQKIPADLYQDYVTLTGQAESVWEEAKQAADYSMFSSYLQQIIDYNRQFINLWGYEEHPYNALLDIYEPGSTVAQFDQWFAELRSRLVPLLQRIQASPYQPNAKLLENVYDKQKQRELCLFILKEIGYDFDAGRLDESSHPFATGLNLGDVRITTRYGTDEMTGSLFGTIHECGHALYDQNIAEELAGTPLCQGASMGIHESQSRFWENIVARSRGFWQKYYPYLQEVFPEPFANIELNDFYCAINHVEPSLIRTEADELTYNLHVMIRYELEKAIFNGELQAEQLPEAWNAKYLEYLGVQPPHDGVGVLQDVHWAAGLFGYFPSYSLGNMYAAQLHTAMYQDILEFDHLIVDGKFDAIKDWLVRNIHQHGKMFSPSDLIRNATGEHLVADQLVTYLEKKYSEIYRLP